MNRDPRAQLYAPKPESLRDMLKRQLKCGDLELADLYNFIFDESRPGPLRQKQLERMAAHYEFAEHHRNAVRSAPEGW